MKSRNELVEYLLDQLEPLGNVTSKSMFGGYGIYSDGVMFGIVADGGFFLKVASASLADFEREGLSPFTYTKKGRKIALSYYSAPPDALDNPETMLTWARKALDAAMRAAAIKKKRPRTRHGNDQSDS